MKLLLDDKFAPITSEIGFVEADCAAVAREFANWQRNIHEPRGLSIVERSVSGTLEKVLEQLLPLTSVECRRFLFVPTDSRWTAFFDNGYRGTSAMSTVSYLAKQM